MATLKMPPLRAMLVYAPHDGSEESVDLIVYARHRDEALQIWRKYCNKNGWAIADLASWHMSVVALPQPPRGAKPGAINWGDLEMVK